MNDKMKSIVNFSAIFSAGVASAVCVSSAIKKKNLLAVLSGLVAVQSLGALYIANSGRDKLNGYVSNFFEPETVTGKQKRFKLKKNALYKYAGTVDGKPIVEPCDILLDEEATEEDFELENEDS